MVTSAVSQQMNKPVYLRNLPQCANLEDSLFTSWSTNM